MPGSGLHFTAYSTWPGNASTNARVFDWTVAGRRQCIGTSGRSVATSSSTDGSGAGAGKRRRRGETAERRRSVFMAESSQAPGARRGAASGGNRGKSDRRADTAAATHSADAARTSHRGKPISKHRRLPNDPGPTTGPDRPKRTRYVVAVPQRISTRGSRHVRCVKQPPHPGGRSGSADIESMGAEQTCEHQW